VVSITDAANSIKNLTGSPEIKATLESAQGNGRQSEPRRSFRLVPCSTMPTLRSVRWLRTFGQTSDEADKTMKDTRAALVGLQQTLDPNAPLAVRLNQALDSDDRELPIDWRAHRLSAAQSWCVGPRAVLCPTRINERD